MEKRNRNKIIIIISQRRVGTGITVVGLPTVGSYL